MTVLAAVGVGGCGVLTGHTQLVHEPRLSYTLRCDCMPVLESTSLLPLPRKPSTHGIQLAESCRRGACCP